VEIFLILVEISPKGVIMRLYFVIKPNKSTKDCYVILKYKFKSKQIDLSPSIKVKKSDFGDGKSDNPIKRTDTEFLRKNEVLRGLREQINQILYKLNSEGVEPSCEMVKNQFKKLEKEKFFDSKLPTQSTSFLVTYVIDKYLEHVKSNSISRYKLDTNGEGTPYSKSVKSRFEHIKRFIKDTYNDTLDFYEVLDEFYDKLQNYLIGLNLSNVTISKIISQFRQFVRWSQKNNYTKGGDTSYKVTLPTNYKSVNSLTEDEVTTLFKYREFSYLTKTGKVNPKLKVHYKNWKERDYIISEELRKTKMDKNGRIIGDISTGKYQNFTTYEVLLDMFLFGISTGLRWSNLVTIKGINYDFDTKKFTPIQLKTKSKVQIQENELSSYIWMKYVKNKSSFQYVFPLPCKEDERTRRQYNTKGNVHIKEIFKIIGFKRRVEVVSMSGETSTEEKVFLHSIVSFHMGRRTHSSIGVHGGIDPMSMSKQLGHSGLEMTSRYVESDNKKLGGMFDFLRTKKKNEEKELTKEEKLIELRGLYIKKLITKKVYEEKLKELI
jgi:integrase